MHKCKVIAVTNQKGGVGKTTTTENVVIGLARNGCNVLIVDFDPQGDLTSCLGWKNNDSLEHSVSSMLDDGTYYSRKVGDDKVTKHVVKDGKAVLSDAIYGHEYEFKGIKAPNNDYYVRKNISKEYANAGIPFVSADGNIDSKNVVIYGHSSKWDNIILHL